MGRTCSAIFRDAVVDFLDNASIFNSDVNFESGNIDLSGFTVAIEGVTTVESAAVVTVDGVEVGTVGPTHEYQTGVAGRSVTGGVVYRGTEIVGLDGTYLYTDFYENDLRAYNDTFGSGPFDYGDVLPGSGTAIFFEDANREVYTISLFTGAVSKLVEVG